MNETTNEPTYFCPICGEEVEYDTWYQITDGAVFVEWECPECNTAGTDTYRIESVQYFDGGE